MNHTINVGSGEKHQLNKIVDTIKIYLPNLKVEYVDSKATDVKDFCLDISLMKQLENIKFTKFDKAVQETIFFETKRLNLKQDNSRN
jgi:UDP-glucose 4-epimerase